MLIDYHGQASPPTELSGHEGRAEASFRARRW